MTIDINFGYNTEDKKLDGPNFDKSTGFKKGISRYTDKYDYIFEGDDDADDDFSEDKHLFKAGDKIALIENYDWDNNLSEFAGEIEFISNTNAYYDRSDTSVYFLLGKGMMISFSGEYYTLDEEYRNQVNKAFGTNYVEIFVGD
jgi:hypothetical protein